MNSNTDKVVMVSSSFPNEVSARQFGTQLIATQLAACVQIFPNVTSLYLWKGEMHSDTECVLTAKTTEARLPGIFDALHRAHPYDLPECVVTEAVGGSEGYLAWVRGEV